MIGASKYKFTRKKLELIDPFFNLQDLRLILDVELRIQFYNSFELKTFYFSVLYYESFILTNTHFE